MTKAQQSERDEAIARLRETLKPGDTVYCVLRHVSRSGMLRIIDLYKMAESGPVWLTMLAHRAGVGSGYDTKREGLKMGGCGMDMGFAAVYELSSILFPQGFTCIGRSEDGSRYCPASDHSNGDRDYTPHNHPNCGGYALRHRWM